MSKKSLSLLIIWPTNRRSRYRLRKQIVEPVFGQTKQAGGFRAMVGMGLGILAISWLGNFLRWRGRLEISRWFLWGAFLAWPTGFVAVLTGWFTAEVGRQPWVVWGLLRTADAMAPTLTGSQVLATLVGHVI